MKIDDIYNPTLTLIYLPHLDYGLQKYGPEDSKIIKDILGIDNVCKDLIEFYERKNTNIIILSEYGITKVNRAIHLNRELRKHGMIAVREENGSEILDPGASKAFAVADHQIAHVYINDKSKLNEVKDIIKKNQRCRKSS